VLGGPGAGTALGGPGAGTALEGPGAGTARGRPYASSRAVEEILSTAAESLERELTARGLAPAATGDRAELVLSWLVVLGAPAEDAAVSERFGRETPEPSGQA